MEIRSQGVVGGCRRQGRALTPPAINFAPMSDGQQVQHATGDFLLRPLDLGFELVADFQLILDEIVQPFADRLLVFQRQSREGRLDFLDAAHGRRTAHFAEGFK